MAVHPSNEFFCIDHPVAERAYIQLTDVFAKDRRFNQSEFFTIEKPMLLADGTLQREKQISVDHVYMKQSRKSPSLPKNEFWKLPPVVASSKDYGMPPLPLPPGTRFLSHSLSGSAVSSPKFSPATSKKNLPSQSFNPLARQHSVTLSHLEQLRENQLQRSKSCGSSRVSAVTDEYDLWLADANNRRCRNPSRTVTRNEQQNGRQEKLDSYNENFKCGVMCLFLPGFAKRKSVKSKKEEPYTPNVMSRTASLAKFECASWSSSAIIQDNDDVNSSKFFDLPLELIHCSENDANLPARTAFVFERDHKGVMKNIGTREISWNSYNSSGRVTSKPHRQTLASPCISPRLRKSSVDFLAFLEATNT